jgi:hypothetical protein
LSALVRVAALLGVALLLPNSVQVLERFAPALSSARPSGDVGWWRRTMGWSPSPAWATAVCVLAGIAVWRLGGQGEFLYWQF